MKKMFIVLFLMLFSTQAFGAEITIKGVPEGAEESVKNMAMIAIERFLRKRDVKVTDAVVEKFEADVDIIRRENGLDSKYDVGE